MRGSVRQPVELGRRGHKGVARFGYIAVAVRSGKGPVGASVSLTAIRRHAGGERGVTHSFRRTLNRSVGEPKLR